jgi:hypothetical protein
MNFAILAAVLVVASVASVSAQDRPNFEGTWQIDTATSRYYGGAPTETITVDGSRMAISRTVARSTASIVYMLDGTPSKNIVSVAGKQIEVTYTSRWEGNSLVTTIPGPVVNLTEKRSIEANGTMEVELTFDFFKQGKSESSIKVFIKVA